MAYHAARSSNVATTTVKRRAIGVAGAKTPPLLVLKLVAAKRRYASTPVRIRAMPPIRVRKERLVKRRHSSLATAKTRSKPSSA